MHTQLGATCYTASYACSNWSSFGRSIRQKFLGHISPVLEVHGKPISDSQPERINQNYTFTWCLSLVSICFLIIIYLYNQKYRYYNPSIIVLRSFEISQHTSGNKDFRSPVSSIWLLIEHLQFLRPGKTDRVLCWLLPVCSRDHKCIDCVDDGSKNSIKSITFARNSL